jgi:hypothetical protein
MARMATATFRDEHESFHFTRYKRTLTTSAAAAARADNLAKAEFAWRLASMHANRRLPGRHFLVATYLRTPVEYLSILKGAHETREEILAWAEWQEPVCAVDKAGSESQFPPDEDDDSPFFATSSRRKNRVEQKVLKRSVYPQLEAILRGLETKCRHSASEYTVLIPPNSGAVYRQVVMEGFQRAQLDYREEWGRWAREFLPAWLGPDGDAQGRYMGMFKQLNSFIYPLSLLRALLRQPRD